MYGNFVQSTIWFFTIIELIAMSCCCFSLFSLLIFVDKSFIYGYYVQSKVSSGYHLVFRYYRGNRDKKYVFVCNVCPFSVLTFSSDYFSFSSHHFLCSCVLVI